MIGLFSEVRALQEQSVAVRKSKHKIRRILLGSERLPITYSVPIPIPLFLIRKDSSSPKATNFTTRGDAMQMNIWKIVPAKTRPLIQMPWNINKETERRVFQINSLARKRIIDKAQVGIQQPAVSPPSLFPGHCPPLSPNSPSSVKSVPSHIFFQVHMIPPMYSVCPSFLKYSFRTRLKFD